MKWIMVLSVIIFVSLGLIFVSSALNNYNYSKKIAFIIPHPDDETIGVGGTVNELIRNGHHLRFDLMCDGSRMDTPVWNDFNVRGIDGLDDRDYKAEIRQNAFVRVMNLINVTDYCMHGYPDGSLKDSDVYSVVEDLYNKGYRNFWTISGDGNPDHFACFDAVQTLLDKHPEIIVHYFSSYFCYANRMVHEPYVMRSDFVDNDINNFWIYKSNMLNVYFTVNHLMKGLYPYGDGSYHYHKERIF
ncbi:MAG: PIG-L family deacetylase [Methanobrevibacter sp.]|jgi:LmbE family N-acetylglucosaminyl deacetylase|nr:PIG-L family deacetylase [Candidatus Methanovirga aequatorialis]